METLVASVVAHERVEVRGDVPEVGEAVRELHAGRGVVVGLTGVLQFVIREGLKSFDIHCTVRGHVVVYVQIPVVFDIVVPFPQSIETGDTGLVILQFTE